ncbi:hypothetical protein RF11_00209 [Thelohanellus kitauei]|uniref:Uncharacterized protein n=1 Tax=Thelohanellus kitauei TaxID=669202 RepID=A0A0C2JQ73_THEKT|nr:hypothetical protein RF11_00209 [Thelohanellus kitauei]
MISAGIIFKEDNIDQFNFTIDGSKLFIKFNGLGTGEKSDIECNCRDKADEIEIKACQISFSNETSFLGNYSIRHIYKLNKTKKYELLKYLIDMAPKDFHIESFQFYISHLSIEFSHSAEICKKPDSRNPNTTTIKIPYDKEDIIYPCGSINTTQSVNLYIQKFMSEQTGFLVIAVIFSLFLVMAIYITIDALKSRPKKQTKPKIIISGPQELPYT